MTLRVPARTSDLKHNSVIYEAATSFPFPHPEFPCPILRASHHPSSLSTGSGTECELKKVEYHLGKAESTRRAARLPGCQAEAICGSVIQSLTQSCNHSLTATMRQSSNAHTHTHTPAHKQRHALIHTRACGVSFRYGACLFANSHRAQWGKLCEAIRTLVPNSNRKLNLLIENVLK